MRRHIALQSEMEKRKHSAFRFNANGGWIQMEEFWKERLWTSLRLNRECFMKWNIPDLLMHTRSHSCENNTSTTTHALIKTDYAAFSWSLEIWKLNALKTNWSVNLYHPDVWLRGVFFCLDHISNVFMRVCHRDHHTECAWFKVNNLSHVWVPYKSTPYWWLLTQQTWHRVNENLGDIMWNTATENQYRRPLLLILKSRRGKLYFFLLSVVDYLWNLKVRTNVKGPLRAWLQVASKTMKTVLLLRTFLFFFCSFERRLSSNTQWCGGGGRRAGGHGVYPPQRSSWAHHLLEEEQCPGQWPGWEDHRKLETFLQVTDSSWFFSLFSVRYILNKPELQLLFALI